MTSLAVYGTSNALIANGYVDGLRAGRRIDKVDLSAMGASGSLIYPFFLERIRTSSADWAVLDTAVNDLMMGHTGETSADLVRVALETVVTAALSTGSTPFVALFPHLSVLQYPSKIRAVYDEIIEKYSLAYMDVYELATKVIDGPGGMEAKFLFRDVAHLHPEIARLIGRWIGDWLGTHHLPHSEIAAYGLDETIVYIPVSEFASEDSVKRTMTSAILEVEFIILEEGGVVKLPVTQGDRLVGMVYDAANSVGSLQVCIPTGEVHRLSVSDIYTKHRTISRIAAFPKVDLQCGSHLLLTVVPEQDPARKALWNEGLAKLGKAEVALNGIVVRRKSAQRQVFKANARSINIMEDRGDLAVVELIEAIRDVASIKQSA